jgi:hypothetical protein
LPEVPVRNTGTLRCPHDHAFIYKLTAVSRPLLAAGLRVGKEVPDGEV